MEDVSEQFKEMIETQRAFEQASRVIETVPLEVVKQNKKSDEDQFLKILIYQLKSQEPSTTNIKSNNPREDIPLEVVKQKAPVENDFLEDLTTFAQLTQLEDIKPGAITPNNTKNPCPAKTQTNQEEKTGNSDEMTQTAIKAMKPKPKALKQKSKLPVNEKVMKSHAQKTPPKSLLVR